LFYLFRWCSIYLFICHPPDVTATPIKHDWGATGRGLRDERWGFAVYSHYMAIERPSSVYRTTQSGFMYRHDATRLDGRWTMDDGGEGNIYIYKNARAIPRRILIYLHTIFVQVCYLVGFFFLSFAHIFKLFVISSDLPACLSCLFLLLPLTNPIKP